MKKILTIGRRSHRLPLFLIAVAVAALSSSQMALADEPESGDAHIEQIRPSINGTNVDARVTLVDTGTSLRVQGVAVGLVPGNRYFSLLYDVGSPDDGPNACEPTIGPGQPGHLTEAQMIVGFWTSPRPGSDVWTIDVTKTGASYARLGDIGTISVRIVQGPPPAGFRLQGCGSL